MLTLQDLPAPPTAKSGFPWTIATPPPNNVGGVWPKISVVTPSYNQGDYIEETIRSVLLQGYPNLEYIVIDGGSTDHTRDILQKYNDFITAWVSEPDEGQSDAINKGLRRSTGAVMGWLNSDDVLLPNALLKIGAAFRQAETQVVTGFRKIILPNGEWLNFVRGIPHPFFVRHRNIIAQEATYWRRDVWQALGELDASYHFCMDYEYWQRMLANGYEFHLIPDYLSLFRWHETSKTMTQTDVQRADYARLYQRYGIAQDEEASLRKMGVLWDLRYRLAKDLSHQSITDNPKTAHRLLQLIDNRLASLPILGLYWLYRRFRR